ncbi:hypothetical protein ACHWQZ_G001810 [Mnemiopsis leidyi]
MLKGQVSAALKWIKKNPSAVVSLSDSVMDELLMKHPAAQKLDDECTIHGPSYIPDPILFEVINAKLMKQRVNETKVGIIEDQELSLEEPQTSFYMVLSYE